MGGHQVLGGAINLFLGDGCGGCLGGGDAFGAVAGGHQKGHCDDGDNETDLVRRFYVDRYTPRFFEAILESDATYHVQAVCEPEEAGTVTGCVEAVHYEESVELDVTPTAGWKIVGWSDDSHFDGDHRNIDVYEDMDLVVYLEEIEPEGE